MIATISIDGTLHLLAETDLEGYAMVKWHKENIDHDTCMEKIVFHGDPTDDLSRSLKMPLRQGGKTDG